MNDRVLEQIEMRLKRLEDMQAIQELKARYLRACDHKQPDVMRECFVEHGAVIEADGFPSFTDREDWVETFTKLAVANPSIQDMHHGHNPQIRFTSDNCATGLWDLDFCQINVKERTIVHLSGQYTDEYERVAGRWQIRSMRFARGSFVMRQVDAQGVEKVIALGQPPATGFIENS